MIDLDTAYTQCAAAEIRLRRLLAERAGEPAEELQGSLSYGERRISERLRAEVARLNREAMREAQLRARFDEESV